VSKKLSAVLSVLQHELKMWEFCTLVMLLCYYFLTIYNFSLLPYPAIALTLYSLAVAVILLFAYFDSPEKRPYLHLFRRFYIIPVVYLIYSQVYLTHYISFGDCDQILIDIDRWIFGGDITVMLYNIATPWLTEYLQLSYMLFFFLPITLCIELYAKGRKSDFDDVVYYISFAFYVSYLLYFLAPAIGPRFTLHDFHALDAELPGVWLTEFFRAVVNGGAGIAANEPNPAAVVNRDCMPSGHTMITLVTMILAFRVRSSFRYVFIVIGCSLIFSTVYLRYHYGIDVLAGIACAFLTLWLQEPFRKLIRSWGFQSV
jgi:membrane-associated phospholipid phosphatase